MTKPTVNGTVSSVPSKKHVDSDRESVAGEEDPGAALDMPAGGAAALNPGDEALPGTPGTGENLCRECRGSGRLNNAACTACGGTGKITTGVGGA